MIDIDGSAYSGSGAIVRHAAVYAALTGEPVRVRNARAQRQHPGLRPQHLRVIRVIRDLVGATLDGAEVSSRSFEFRPGNAEPAGRYAWDIGSERATMLALSVLPVLAFRGRGAEAESRGGLFQDFAPSAFHLRHVIVPLLAQMRLAAQIEMIRPGYPPAGQGVIRLTVPACERPLGSLTPRRGQARRNLAACGIGNVVVLGRRRNRGSPGILPVRRDRSLRPPSWRAIAAGGRLRMGVAWSSRPAPGGAERAVLSQKGAERPAAGAGRGGGELRPAPRLWHGFPCRAVTAGPCPAPSPLAAQSADMAPVSHAGPAGKPVQPGASTAVPGSRHTAENHLQMPAEPSCAPVGEAPGDPAPPKPESPEPARPGPAEPLPVPHPPRQPRLPHPPPPPWPPPRPWPEPPAPPPAPRPQPLPPPEPEPEPEPGPVPPPEPQPRPLPSPEPGPKPGPG